MPTAISSISTSEAGDNGHLTPALADHGGALLVRHIERLRHTFPASRHSTEFIAIDPR